MPDGQKIEVHDLSSRLMVVPVGTTFLVPDGHEWYITGVAVLPTRGYTPPLGAGETRDARAWGDLCIRTDAVPVTDSLRVPSRHLRANVLALIDRYWGRFNLMPTLPEFTAKLVTAQQLMFTAPKISELYTLMDHLTLAYQQYLDAAAPRLDTPLQFNGGTKFTVEHLPFEDGVVDEVTDVALGNVPVKVTRALDVELSMIVKRPVS